MEKTLTVSELSRQLGVSVNTTWKKIHKRGLRTGKQLINNREITVVILDEEEYNELINENIGSLPINNTVNNLDYEDTLQSEDVHEGEKVTPAQGDVVQIIETVMNYSKDMNEQVKEYVDRVITAEMQVKLLEDSENRKKQDFIEIRAKCKELESRISVLVNENLNLKKDIAEKEKENKDLNTRIDKLSARKIFGIRY